MNLWVAIRNIMTNQIEGAVIGAPIILNKYSVGGWAISYIGEAGNCTSDFSCDPNHLPGYTYYPEENVWRENPLAPEGPWQGNVVPPEVAEKLHELRKQMIEHNGYPEDYLYDPATEGIIDDGTQCIDSTVNTTYRQARTTASPLILDLDGDGVEVSQLAAGAATQILFDHDADGVRTGTAWAKADDGILALDRDGNGTIDSGRELFGNNTLLSSEQRAGDGYAALAELDSDGDGQITALDTLFSQLRVWRDLDQDGVSDDGELISLASTATRTVVKIHSIRDIKRNMGFAIHAQPTGCWNDESWEKAA